MKKFSTRLNSAIMVVTVGLFVLMILLFYNYTQGRLREETLRRADYVFAMMDMQVDKVFSSTEQMMRLFSGEIERSLDRPDEIPRIVHNMVAFNSEITSSIVAFVPDYYKEKGRFYAPISSLAGDSIRDYLLTEEAQAYISHNWYVAPMRTSEDSSFMKIAPNLPVAVVGGYPYVTERIHLGDTPTEVIREITASVENFVGGAEQSDDLTILTIRYVG